MTASDTPIYWGVLIDTARSKGTAIVQDPFRVCWCGALFWEDCRTRSGISRDTPHKGRQA